MTRAELLAELRSVVVDTAAPYAWSDARLLSWLSEGQDKFCALTGFWSDKTSYTITTILNQLDYPIPSRIISVRAVYDGTRKLYDGAGMTFSEADFADVTAQSPQHYRTDAETGVLTLFEPPTAGIVLSLRVHRKSKKALNNKTNGSYDTDPEVMDEFQLGLVEYAAGKAFGDHDRELQDPVKAADHMSYFKSYVHDGKKAYRRLTGEYSDVIPSPLYVV